MTVVQTTVDGSPPDFIDPWPSSYAGRQTNLPVTGMTPPLGLRLGVQDFFADDRREWEAHGKAIQDEGAAARKRASRRNGMDAFEDE